MILGVATRWFSQYRGTNRKLQDGRNSNDIYNLLYHLDKEKATVKDVADIIGNDSWTNLTCNECKAEQQPCVVQLGEEQDCESYTANLCPACIAKANELCSGRFPTV
jgi:hypothetical protein